MHLVGLRKKLDELILLIRSLDTSNSNNGQFINARPSYNVFHGIACAIC
jgi:hypothetical protein